MKIKTLYTCQNCGYQSAKWLGRCSGCESWNTLVEETVGPSAPASGGGNLRGQALEGAPGTFVALDDSGDEATESSETGSGRSRKNRVPTGIAELDRVLGGGMVPDSFTLLGGDPGIGKSTLLLQMSKGLLESNPDLKILYVSGEESIEQIRSRAKRIGVTGVGRIFLSADTQLERVMGTVKEVNPDVLVMDSLQTFSSGYLQSAPGSVGQVREITQRLMQVAKTDGIAVWIVGHVTKEGSIAGPKVVEHMVDTVLYFEGEGGQSYRLLRTVKNRFGSTRELGVFEMDGEGLREVSNPSSLFLSERKEAAAGTAITASLEGTRPLLVELQALVSPSPLSMPRRTSVGMDSTRIALLAAILERHARLSLAQQDLFFNVAGGLKLSEPSADLAAAAAIWSSTQDFAFPMEWIFIGELGLTGEVRRVPQIEVRLLEAKKLGFKVAVIPAGTQPEILRKNMGIELIPVSRVGELRELAEAVSRVQPKSRPQSGSKPERPDAGRSAAAASRSKSL